MLVITRKTGESINIGDNIVVAVLKTSGRYVKLGLVAPGENIRRSELIAVRAADVEPILDHPDRTSRIRAAMRHDEIDETT